MRTRIGPALATAGIAAAILTTGLGGGQAAAEPPGGHNCPGHYAYHQIYLRGVIAETCRTWDAIGNGYYIGAWEIRHKAMNAGKVVVEGKFDGQIKELKGTSGIYERTKRFTIRACGTNQEGDRLCSDFE